MSLDLLNKILEKEVLSEDLTEISRGDLSDLIEAHKNTLVWCSRRYDARDLCRKYFEVLRETIVSLANIRIIKGLREDALSSKDPLIDIVRRIRDLYLIYLLKTPIDPYDKIPVRILADIRVGDKIYLSKRSYLLSYETAIRFILSGLAEPLELSV